MSLEVITLAFLENKSIYVCRIFAKLIFTFEKKVNQCFKKNRVMRILQIQSVTLFFLCFYYSHELESGNIYNKK